MIRSHRFSKESCRYWITCVYVLHHCFRSYMYLIFFKLNSFSRFLFLCEYFLFLSFLLLNLCDQLYISFFCFFHILVSVFFCSCEVDRANCLKSFNLGFLCLMTPRVKYFFTGSEPEEFLCQSISCSNIYVPQNILLYHCKVHILFLVMVLNLPIIKSFK